MKTATVLLLTWFLGAIPTFAQTSRIVSWQDFPAHRAYEPMPVICVHGITSGSAECWGYGVDVLSNYFSTTYYWQGAGAAPLQIPNYQPGAAYVETFDYGTYGRPQDTNTLGHLQTFDSIRSNAWEGVYQQSANNSITLSQRVGQVRSAYKPPNQPEPPVTLLCHSMGGVLAHYYLMKCAQTGVDPGVARLVTLGTPHYGAPIVNYVRGAVSVFGSKTLMEHPKAFLAIDCTLHKVLGLKPQDWVNFCRLANAPTGSPEKVGLTEMSYNLPIVGSLASWMHNPLIPTFQNNSVPGSVEYVANSFVYPAAANLNMVGVSLLYNAVADIVGDVVVPCYSQEGRPSPNHQPDIYNGNTSSGRAIRPVIFSGWEHFHIGESTMYPAIAASLFGVPYRYGVVENLEYPPNFPLTSLPVYAGSPGDTNSFSKYLPTQDGSFTHSDEPGIAQMFLCYSNSVATNLMLIPAANAMGIIGNLPSLLNTNQTNFVGAQIVGPGTYDPASLCAFGIVGTKNHSPNALQNSATNYWAAAGNEYLPASLGVYFNDSATPVPDATAQGANLPPAVNAVSQCLVQSGTNLYGYFVAPSSSVSEVHTGNNYIAAQGQNLAGMLTPQAQLEFNVVVDSATLVSILQKINHGEALSNCNHNATTPTRWTATVSEWVNSNTGSITLDFFPTASPPNVYDAWTRTPYTYLAYNPTNNTITVNPTNAPSQLIVSNQVYLGCYQVFTNSYGGIVSNLTSGALAGVPISETFLDTIRSSLAAVIPKYQNTYITSTCSNWTKPDIIQQATSGVQTDWTPVVSGLLLPQHFTELKAVTDLLTTEFNCNCYGACCSSNGSSCTITTQAACISPNKWQGPATVCSPNPCHSSCADSSAWTLEAAVFGATDCVISPGDEPPAGYVYDSSTVSITKDPSAHYYLKNITGCSQWETGCTKCGTSTANNLYVDNEIVLNGSVVISEGYCALYGPVDVTSALVNGANTFEAVDFGIVYAKCAIGLYSCK